MDDVRDLFLGMPHGTTPAAVTTNKNIIMSSFVSFKRKRVGQTATPCIFHLIFHFQSFISTEMKLQIPMVYFELMNMVSHIMRKLA